MIVSASASPARGGMATNVRLAFVMRPFRGGGVPHGVLPIQFSAVLYQQPDHVEAACCGGLMKRRGVRVSADRVVAIRIFAGIEQ